MTDLTNAGGGTAGSGPNHEIPDGADGTGAPGRGVALTAAAFVIGVLVLASIGHISSTSTASASTTTTTAPGSATSTTLATHNPSTVTVLVCNGTDAGLLATDLKTQLTPSGWDILAPNDTTSTVTASGVYYRPGYQGDARAVARDSGISSGAVQPVNSTLPVPSNSADVIVIIGPDLAQAVSAGAAGGTSTSGGTSSNGTSSGGASSTG